MADNPIYRPAGQPMIPGQSAQMTVDALGNLRVVMDTTNTPWSYVAASGGLTNTTAATIAPAVAGFRNGLTNLQIASDALTAATQIVVRDGANGTVLWRSKIQTLGLAPTTVTFKTPLMGSVNTLLEVALLTSPVTGAVYFNAQGYLAA